MTANTTRGHQWNPKSETKLTGGTNFQVRNLAPSTLPANGMGMSSMMGQQPMGMTQQPMGMGVGMGMVQQPYGDVTTGNDDESTTVWSTIVPDAATTVLWNEPKGI